MDKLSEFQIYFDGSALEGGVIDARELAPSLIALADLFDASNLEVTGGKADVKLKVHADFKNKCFEVNLSVFAGYAKQFVDIFSAPEAQAVGVMCSIVGVSGIGLLQLIKRSKGKPLKRKISIQRTEKVEVEFEGEEPFEVDQKVLNLFDSQKVREAASKFVEPLVSAGYDEVGIRYKGQETFHLNKTEVYYFRPLSDSEEELVAEAQAYVRIDTMSFKEGNKWRVHDGSSSKNVEILDIDFLRRVRVREELFGNNDYLRVLMRTRQWREDGKIKASHSIVKVLTHEGMPKNGKLDFGSDES
jgi:hypothetical protein